MRLLHLGSWDAGLDSPLDTPGFSPDLTATPNLSLFWSLDYRIVQGLAQRFPIPSKTTTPWEVRKCRHPGGMWGELLGSQRMRFKDTDSDIRTLISTGRLFAFLKDPPPQGAAGLCLSDLLGAFGLVPSLSGPGHAGFYLLPSSQICLPSVPGMEELRGKAGPGRSCWEHADSTQLHPHTDGQSSRTLQERKVKGRKERHVIRVP